MMRKIFVSLLLLVSGYAMAQPANYVPYASRNRYIALMADSTFHIPRFNGAPSLRTGGSTNDGALAADTANNRLYIYNGGSWTVVNKDTSNTFLNSLYKKSGTDSVFQIKGGTHTFAFTVGGSGSGDGIASLGTSAYGLTTQNDSTYKVDTSVVSTKLWRQKGIDSVQANVNLKTNISDTATMLQNYVRAQRLADTAAAIRASITGGGDTSTFIVDTTFKRLAYAINEDSLRLKSVTIDVTTGQAASYEETDSTLKFTIPQFDSEIYGVVPPSTGTTTDFLRADGTWATPAGGGGADSSVFATQYRLDTVKANRVRYVDTATMLTNYPTFSSFTSGRFALVNGSKTLYSSSKFNFSDATYPTMSIIGSDPLIYIGPSATLLNNPAFGHSAGAVIYGGATYKGVQLVDQISGGIQMARFYNSSGTIYNNLNGLVISNTLSSPSNYQGSYTIQRTVPYAVTGLNYHGFTDQTDFRVGTNSFNSFGSFVTIGNNRTSQGHFAAFQSVWYKDSTNRLQAIYDFVSAVSEMRSGTVDTVYRFKVFEMTKTGGTIVKQYGIHIPALTAATTNVGAYIEDNVGLGTDQPTAKLDINSDKFRVRTAKTPSSATDTGNAGDICWDSNYIYICVSTNSWKRVAIATW